MEWQFHTPDFIFKKDLSSYTWSGHMFFAYDLVRNLNPKLLVELGTYKGTSFFSFSQGVKDANIDTKLICIDSWEGDEQTDFYEEDIFKTFTTVLEKHFKDLNVEKKRMYFDDAVDSFKDKAIDILHIDGLHTYEAVRHDYDTWKDKVSENGVILFHDIKVQSYGVKEVWDEIKKENPDYTFVEFEHNYGLGIIFKNQEAKALFTNDFKKEFIQHYFDISIEYRLQQRIVELENDVKMGEKGRANLDLMLKKVLEENKELYKKRDSLQSIIDKQNEILNKKAVKAVLKISNNK